MLDLIIFDCDGVLFDSRRANVAFHNTVLEKLGQPLLDVTGEDLGHFMAADQLYDHLFGADTPLRARASEIARSLDYAPFYEFMHPVDGLFEILDQLKRRYHLAMASNRARTAQGVAERFGLDRYLSLVVGTRDVPRPKPAPDMLHLCMQRLGVDPAATLFVGDAVTDRDAARAADVRFIGVGPHSGVADPINSFDELPARLPHR